MKTKFIAFSLILLLNFSVFSGSSEAGYTCHTAKLEKGVAWKWTPAGAIVLQVTCPPLLVLKTSGACTVKGGKVQVRDAKGRERVDHYKTRTFEPGDGGFFMPGDMDSTVYCNSDFCEVECCYFNEGPSDGKICDLVNNYSQSDFEQLYNSF